MDLNQLGKYIRWGDLMALRVDIIRKLELTDRYSELPWQLVEELSPFLHWDDISETRLSEDFMHDHSQHLDWSKVLEYNNVSLDFIRNHLHSVRNNWDEICRYQDIADDQFLEEFSDLINFKLVSRFQKLSISQISKFRSKLDFSILQNFQRIPAHIITELKPKV